MIDRPTAILFPGQGSQAPGMRELVEEVRPDLLELVVEALGCDPFERVDESTRFAQPAIFCASLAGWELVRATEFPVAMAGHSLGELTALVAAGAIDEVDGVRLACARGQLMAEAADQVPGAMVALRASVEQAEELVADTEVVVANHNAPQQVVVSGPEAAVAALEARLEERGVGNRRLPVRGAFHSPLMAEAARRFAEELAQVDLRQPGVPVIACATGRPFADIQTELAEAIVRPVRFVGVVEELRSRGVERFVEVGPGRVLSGLVRRIDGSLEVVGPPTPEVVDG